jgi:predicted RNA methylase
MNAYLPGLEDEKRDHDRSQWYTPPKLAERVWDWANELDQPRTVLEPAAGQGALIKPIYVRGYHCHSVVAVDIDPQNVARLDVLAHRQNMRIKTYAEPVPHAGWIALQHNFLELYKPPALGGALFDLALTNPPYEEGLAEAFVLHALTVATRVVGIFKASILHGGERHRTLWRQAYTTREVRLMTRPTFGAGESGSKAGLTDFVVLEIRAGEAPPMRVVRTENWP